MLQWLFYLLFRIIPLEPMRFLF